MELIFLQLVFLLGAAHMLSPDHWVPVSVQAWQKSWRFRFTALISFLLISLHILLGLILFLSLKKIFILLDSTSLIAFTVLWTVSFTYLRSQRFSRLHTLLWGGPKLHWKIISLLLFLGPSESLIPVLIKAHSMQINFLYPILAYWAGSVLLGCPLMILGQILTDRPLGLPQQIQLAQKKYVSIPSAALTAIGLIVLFQIR